MSIRNKLVTLLIAGFTVVFSIFFYSTQTLKAASDAFTSESLAQTYSAAWLSASDAQFERSVEKFDPELGAPDIIMFWDPLENTFSTRDEAVGGENPLTSALVDGRTDLAQGDRKSVV